MRILGDHLRKGRLDLGLLQNDVSQSLGVDEASVYNWENHRSSPSLHLIPKVIKFIGDLPFSVETDNLGEKIIALRRALEVRQEDLARHLDVDPTTLASWELGKGQPLNKHMEKLADFLNAQFFREDTPILLQSLDNFPRLIDGS